MGISVIVQGIGTSHTLGDEDAGLASVGVSGVC